MRRRPLTRITTAASILLVAGACETHTLTRPADGNVGFRWALVWIATLMWLAVVSGALVQVFGRSRPPNRRLIAAFFFAVAAGVLLYGGSQGALEVRRAQLEHQYGGCVEVAEAARESSLVPIFCTEGVEYDMGITLVFAAIYLVVAAGLALATFAFGMAALRAEPSMMWVPGIGTIFIALAAGSAVTSTYAGRQLASVLVFLAAAAASGFVGREWITTFGPRHRAPD